MTRRLIVTADDFGMSLEVNEAVEVAHREGILTCASLVVAGDAAEDAIRRAKRMPSLGVGLHLAMHGARTSAKQPSALARDGENLDQNPVRTGLAVMLWPSARQAARREFAAQFEAYRKSGLPLGHLDGHWHCHQHPAVLAMALELGKPMGLKGLRIPHEPHALVRAVSGHGSRLQSAGMGILALEMRRQARKVRIAVNDHFFGMADGGFIDSQLLRNLAAHLPEGVSEVGLHPSTANWHGPHAPPPHWQPALELTALTDPAVRDELAARGVELCRWADLA
ncbi:MAG: hopanoid biosynthesis-associated protein HpnK [Novosphingobium sp.]